LTAPARVFSLWSAGHSFARNSTRLRWMGGCGELFY
jgi:hypothetical protein